MFSPIKLHASNYSLLLLLVNNVTAPIGTVALAVKYSGKYLTIQCKAMLISVIDHVSSPDAAISDIQLNVHTRSITTLV